MRNADTVTHSDTINKMTDELVVGSGGGPCRAQLSTSKRVNFFSVLLFAKTITFNSFCKAILMHWVFIGFHPTYICERETDTATAAHNTMSALISA